MPTFRRSPLPRALSLVGATLAATVLLGCSSGSDPSASDPTTASTVERDAPAPVETFTGSVDEFYDLADPLPPGEPGDLIRVQEVASGDAAVTTRMMYRSVDGAGRDRAVSAIVTVPTAPSPEGGRPVLVTAPGTVGLGSSCALSRRGDPPPGFGVDGIHVMTDYIGMGPFGEVHPYLSRASEGHSVLDGARAARALVGREPVSR